jgi:hypothetical protein
MIDNHILFPTKDVQFITFKRKEPCIFPYYVLLCNNGYDIKYKSHDTFSKQSKPKNVLTSDEFSQQINTI